MGPLEPYIEDCRRLIAVEQQRNVGQKLVKRVVKLTKKRCINKSGEGFEVFGVVARKPLFYLLLAFVFWPAQHDSNVRPTP